MRPGPQIVIPFRAPRASAPVPAAARIDPARVSTAARARVQRLIAEDHLVGAQLAVEELLEHGEDPVALALQGDVHA